MTISIDPQDSNTKSLQPKGWLRYFSFSLDHKVIGIQYLVCGFLFYLIGGTLASAIRIELASPMSDFMPRDVYNQVLTLHGTIMIFFTFCDHSVTNIKGIQYFDVSRSKRPKRLH